MEKKSIKRQSIFRIIYLSLIIITIILIFLLIKNEIISIIQLASQNRNDELRELIENQKIWGKLSIIIIEAIQMILIFFPAEFVQLAAALTNKVLMAFILCEIGVFIGASIIYLLTNLLKFKQPLLYKSKQKINKIANSQKKSHSSQVLMYLLFISPIIPFGAICYFGSSSKISYRRYIITCITGVIPSIASSICMANAFLFFSANNIPIWLLLLIIILLMAILFSIIMTIIKKFFLIKETNQPNGFLYDFFFKIFNLYSKIFCKIYFDLSELDQFESPCIILSNHPSFFDFMFVSKFIDPYRMSFILNRYYFRYKRIGSILKKLNGIPKKLFYPDMETIKLTIKASRNNNVILMCPEGRLSVDGTNYPIVKGTGELIKKINIPVFIFNINGAYLSNPKWKKHYHRGPVEICVKRKITKDEISSLTSQEIDQIIEENITYNDFEFAKRNKLRYGSNKKAEGLENILYYCPHCHQEFTVTTKKNKVSCTCGFEVEINKDFSFTENIEGIENIHQWYEIQKQYERINLTNEIELETNVKIKKINLQNSKLDIEGNGICYLKGNTLSFQGSINDEPFSFTQVLSGLAFSCGEEFECYYQNELYYFYPTNNPKQCVKWANIVDVANEMENKNESK